MQTEKPSIKEIVEAFKARIQGCYVGDAEIEDLKRLYPNVSYRDLRRTFYEAINKHAMQPVSYMTRQLRVLRPEADPFNTQVSQQRARGIRVEKGTDWTTVYTDIRERRLQAQQAYDQQHGQGSWRKKQDRECAELHQKFVDMDKAAKAKQQANSTARDYDSWSDEEKAWYDNLVKSVLEEGEKQKKKQQKELAEKRQKAAEKKQKLAEARRHLQEFVKANGG